MNKHWNENHLKSLNEIKTLDEMVQVAFGVLKGIPKPVVQVCGPISVGGSGSIGKNLVAFSKAIEWLSSQGHNVFDQMPFEKPMHRLVKNNSSGYPTALLDEFYLPIFESGSIKTLAFLPDWQSSTGARWEHEQAKRLNIDILYLPSNWDRP